MNLSVAFADTQKFKKIKKHSDWSFLVAAKLKNLKRENRVLNGICQNFKLRIRQKQLNWITS